MIKKWYLLCSKPNSDKKLVAILTRKGIETYSPLNRIEKFDRNKKIVSFESLFPSFVFVYITEAEIAKLTAIDAVVNFFYWLGKPVVLNTAEIENIQYFTKQYPNIRLAKININNTGVLEEVYEYNKAITPDSKVNIVTRVSYKLLLPALGYSLIADRVKPVSELVDPYYRNSDQLS